MCEVFRVQSEVGWNLETLVTRSFRLCANRLNNFKLCIAFPGWLGGIMVGSRTLDQMVMVQFPPGRCQATTYGQVVYTHVPLLPSSINWYWQKVGSKQATTRHTGSHVCYSHFSWCLAEGLELEISAAPAGSDLWTNLLFTLLLSHHYRHNCHLFIVVV